MRRTSTQGACPLRGDMYEGNERSMGAGKRLAEDTLGQDEATTESEWAAKRSVPDQRTAFPSSCSLYALSTTGLQSTVSDQSGASVTCSCVYCQHRPVLGQLGEQEKARQQRA
ncbi:hypothetical protein GBF38_004578 [Nibea albiflora]|uniref:Uncharacterized protein n=1 Tax=Nibea albiflora TaxID=240163 RepID=A0ACB7FC53_NIBAL|nr:hypothetical protein GBF38_004578 [Nibea albiflora]